MSMLKLSGWALLIAVGCNGKLTVNDGEGGAGGSAGARDFGSTAGNQGVGGNNGVAGEHGIATAGHAGVGTAGLDQADHPGREPTVPPFTAGAGGCPDFGCGEPAGGFGGSPYPGGSGGRGGHGGSIGRGGRGGFGGDDGGFAGDDSTGVLGSLGQTCIPGELVTEAEGTPAKTQIRTLPHCDEGLKCNAQNVCVVPPDCPQSTGLCVVRHALASGSGGVGGADYNGYSGADNQHSVGGNGQIVHNATNHSGVLAMAASESRVYWVEYGTRDQFEYYQHDGALLSYAFADGTTTVIASGLEGPVSVEITTSHAYIYTDGGRPLHTPMHSQLSRVPLTGGSVELVQDGTSPSSFAAAGSRAFWATNNEIYSMPSDANAVPALFVAAYSYGLATDATDLYYGSDTGVMRSPLASAAPVALGVSGTIAALYGDGVFALESISEGGGLLQRAPKSGGEFLRVRALGSATPDVLQPVADRYFVGGTRPGQWSNGVYRFKAQVLSAGFVGSDPPIRLLERNAGSPQPHDGGSLPPGLTGPWVGTASDLYWSEGRTIYKQPLPTP